MALLNEKGFERKLQQMSLAQDSVQTVSLWIIHHKKYAGDIVKVWTENLKKCNPDRRLVMLYLANDVLQNSRKKGKEFSTAFSKVLKDVIPLLCERKISESVQRVMKIWQERKVFEKEFIESLQRQFDELQGKSTKVPRRKEIQSNNDGGTPKLEIKHTPKIEKPSPPADFKPSQLIDALKAMRDLQAEVTLKESQLNSLRIDASDMEAIKQLKDRATGAKFTAEYEAATVKLESFCETLKCEKGETLKLIQGLEDGKLFYDAAFGEVKVIVHAYKTFGNRLNNLKKKVDNKVAKIINAEAEKKKMGPIHTPQASFLTSGLPDISSGTPASTPPQQTDGTETVETGKVVDPTLDNTEVADMDLEDDDDSENGEDSDSPSDSNSTPSSDVKSSETINSNTSIKPTVTTRTTTATTTSSPLSSHTSSTTTSLAFTGTTSSIPVQMAVPPQMMMQQPTMQFIPGQPGMTMIPVGMHSTGQFISMPSQYPQPMVPYGMGMHGMGSFPGNVQPQMTSLIPGQGPFHGMAPNLPQQIPGNPSVSQMVVGTSSLTHDLNQSSASFPGQSIHQSMILPHTQVSMVNLYSPTTPTHSVSKPLPSASIESPVRESFGSPSSEMSAPSPVGSPELELGGDETPETASPKGVADVKIIGFPSISGQRNRHSEMEVEHGNLSQTSEEASAPSTGSASPNHSRELSKPVSAVNILAQLISRGRQLKEKTSDIENTSGTSTPQEDPPPIPPPQQEKPLFSLIDSLFPKLTDSLNTIRQREKDNETSTSTSEEGSPKQKIEINAMGDDDDDSENEGNSEITSEPLERDHVHRGQGVTTYHPAGFPQGGPRGPFVGHPPDGPLRQPWNADNFPNHIRPPYGDYQESPHIPPTSPAKAPGHSPRFPTPQRTFPGPQGNFFGPPEAVEAGEVPRDDFRGVPQRSPHQLHSPRALFHRPPIGDHEPDMKDGPPNDGPPRGPKSPRGAFIGGHHSRGPPGPQERGPRFRFESSPGVQPRPGGPPEMYRLPPGGSPQRHFVNGPPKPRWRGPEGPRGTLPPHDDARVFQRTFSDGDANEMSGEPPMKRPMREEGPSRPYPEQGRPPRPAFPHDVRGPTSPGFERKREIWREREEWEHGEPRLVPDRIRPEFHEREGFIDHSNRPFPPERPPFHPHRRNSFKGFEHREHFIDQRPRPPPPRLPFQGAHQRPFY